VLIDEAYHHYVEIRPYESTIPLIKQYPNLIVARTFQRYTEWLVCAAAIALPPQLIQRMRVHQTWDSVNNHALVAATASLQDTAHVEEGRRRNGEVRNTFIPSWTGPASNTYLLTPTSS